ncbi:hypothetical protein [Allokutzneria oryzae]|uniref:Uncharacterized protein n=1 Tax=Allokutzneria oryzae TaxID=1378989 RepID=A0ABV6A398_9PSEU
MGSARLHCVLAGAVAVAASAALALPLSATAETSHFAKAADLACGFTDAVTASNAGWNDGPYWRNCKDKHVEITLHNAVTSPRNVCIPPHRPGEAASLKGLLGFYEIVRADERGLCNTGGVG